MIARRSHCLQNCSSYGVFPVCTGQHLLKAVQGRNIGEPVTGSWAPKAHWRTWAAKSGPCGLIQQTSYCRGKTQSWSQRFLLYLVLTCSCVLMRYVHFMGLCVHICFKNARISILSQFDPIWVQMFTSWGWMADLSTEKVHARSKEASLVYQLFF